MKLFASLFLFRGASVYRTIKSTPQQCARGHRWYAAPWKNVAGPSDLQAWADKRPDLINGDKTSRTCGQTTNTVLRSTTVPGRRCTEPTTSTCLFSSFIAEPTNLCRSAKHYEWQRRFKKRARFILSTFTIGTVTHCH